LIEKKTGPSWKRVVEVFDYDFYTGDLKWRVKKAKRNKIGDMDAVDSLGGLPS